ncbi:MAG: GtrA family protein, partial [Clostridia bacterium]|nr:GtrA family protein [Clostridia bacterium]
PYFLTNLYVRFAFSEMFIMLAFPMIIWGIYELVENKNYKLFMIFFTGGYILAFLTHIALTIFITIFVAVYVLFNIKKGIKEKLYIPFAISCVIVLICILFFYIPMALNLGITQQDGMGRSGEWLWATAASIFWENYLAPSTYPVLVVFIIFNILFFRKKEKKTRLEKMLYAFATSSIILLSPVFPWIIMGFSPFNMIQFAWRMFSIVSLPAAFMVGYIIKNIKLKPVLYATLTIIVATLSIYLGFSPTIHPYQLLNDVSISLESYFSSDCGLGGGKNGDYYPNGATREYVFSRGNNLISDTNLEVTELANYQTIDQLAFFLSPYEQDGYVTLKIPYEICEDIKASQYWVTWGREVVDLQTSNENGYLKIEIPHAPESSQIIIKYNNNSAFDKYLQENPFEFLIKSGNATAFNFVKQNVNNYEVDFIVTEETVVELPTFFYKGYTLTYTTASGEVKTLEAMQGENGFVEVKLTESGTLKVEYKPNYIKYSDIISILGLIIFLIACGVVLIVPREFFSAIADWIDRFFEKYKTLAEIIRFLVVGAISTIVDMLVMGIVMYAMQPSIYTSIINVFINSPNPSTLATIIGTTVGSIAGMLVSYVLSIIFVFNEKGESKSVKGFVVFALLTAIGLGINMLGTYILYDLLFVNQWITKIIMVIIVLIYNYISKRLMLFKDKPKTAEDKILDILLKDSKKNKKHK